MSYMMDALLGAATKTTGYRPSDDSTAVLFGVQPTSASGQIVNQETALNISAVWCAINLIANAVKSLPWFTYRYLADGKELVPDDPIYKLLHKVPNSEMNASRFKRLLVSWGLVWGSGPAEIERNRRGQPIALWPIHPSRTRAYRNDAGRIVHDVWNEDGSRVTLPDADVYRTMALSKDGITPLSAIGLARESLGLTVAAEAYGARFFGNNARPSVILEHPNAVDDEDKLKALRKSWQETMGGENIHGTVILEDGMTAKIMSMPNEDAQFLETRTFQIVEVARWFNIPPHKLKELTHATFSNIEHLAIEYVGDAILPWVIDMEEEADRKLLPADGKLFTEFLMDGLLRTDAKARNEALAIQRQWGIISADEWRAKENQNPQPDGQGEIYIVPKNYASATDFTEEGRVELPAPPVPPMPGSIPQPEPEPEPAPEGRAFRQAIAEAHRPIFADVIGRMDRKQQAAIKRAAKKPESFEAWQEQFYLDHATTIRAALIPYVEALGGALRATLAKPIPDAEWDEFTGNFTKATVEKLIVASRTGCGSDTFASEIIFLFVKCMTSAFKGGSDE